MIRFDYIIELIDTKLNLVLETSLKNSFLGKQSVYDRVLIDLKHIYRNYTSDSFRIIRIQKSILNRLK